LELYFFNVSHALIICKWRKKLLAFYFIINTTNLDKIKVYLIK